MNYDIKRFDTIVFKTKVNRFWRGFDACEGMHGCACLAETKTGKYLHFYRGAIDVFKTTEPIEHYASPMGNNLVPDAIGYSKNNIFILSDYRLLRKANIPNVPCYLDSQLTFSNPWHAQLLLEFHFRLPENNKGCFGREIPKFKTTKMRIKNFVD